MDKSNSNGEPDPEELEKELEASLKELKKEQSREHTNKRQEYMAKARAARAERLDEIHGDITPKQARLVHYLSIGMPNAQAYFEAGYGHKDMSAHDASANVSSMLRQAPKMRAYLKELQEAAFLVNVLSLAEKRAFLADVVRTPIGKIDINDKLAQCVKYRDGEMIELRMPDKVKAVELDAKLAGELRENHVAVNIGMQLVNERLAAIDLPRDAVEELPAPGNGDNPLK